MAASGRPEDMRDKRPYPGKAGIGSFGRETLLSSERGHGRTAAAAEERADHPGGLRTNTASKIRGCKPCGESYLKASPYVRYVRVLGEDSGESER